ncbi:MAG: hypothetical protein K2P25_07055, partial [Lachnospiraceae bacterium]|nr:hypothetical protein [Lachnospiraceae bacterium]
MKKNVIKNILPYRQRLRRIFCILLLPACLFLIGIADNRQKTLEEDPSLYKTVDAKGVFHIYNLKDFNAFQKYVLNGHKELDAVLEADLDMDKSPY